MASTVEQIKSRLNIADVVGSYLKLEKAGGNFKAKCPFHNEKTPSFYISPAKEAFHCFGCNKGGDMINFVEEIEGVDFLGAIKILAARAGVEIETEDPRFRSERTQLLSLLEKASSFYQSNLQKFPKVIEYLKKRGLTDKTIGDFKIGFSTETWREGYQYLKKTGFTDAEIEKAGLSIKSKDGYYDRFRNRIMFPICNSSGAVVGFSGRIFDYVNKDAGNGVGKYINSPQTLLYDKSNILYGLDKAKVEIRKADTCIVVEGQMDLIMSHQAGFINTVAVSGTALTSEHIISIKRLANKLILAFDGDEAGIKAATRSIVAALDAELNTLVVAIPGQLDPADIILRDPKEWKEIISGAKHIVDFYLDYLRAKHKDGRQFKLEAGKNILPFIARIKNSIDQAHFVSKLAQAIETREESIWEELKKSKPAQSTETIQAVKNDKSFEKEQNTPDRSKQFLRKIHGLILWQEEMKEPQIKIEDAKIHLKEIIKESSNNLDERPSKEDEGELSLEAELYYGGSENIPKILDSLLFSLQEEILKKKFEDVM
ncbi:MAG: DNA primase, partial [Candidatus Paceibacterota bacterium]